tara:strand:+ start:2151 stop:2528 length:378 start_codon:yes stop_codon:yes gene_type:complete
MIGLSQSWKDYTYTQKEKNETLVSMMKEMNKTCPKVLDKYTTLVSTYGGDGIFRYNFQVSEEYFNTMKITKKEYMDLQTVKAKNMFCTDPSIEMMKVWGVNITWKWYSDSGIVIGEITLNRKDCN